ncbi:MAG: type II CAAX endopeptidase family protein [Bacteroidales bacterium]
MMRIRDFAIQLPPKGMRILRFPLTRLLLAIIFLIAFLGVGVFISSFIRGALLNGGHRLLGDLFQMIILSLMAYAGYLLYCGLVEGRAPGELSADRLLVQTGSGLLMGFGFISLIILLIAIGNGYRIDGWNNPYLILPALIMSIQAGIVEEIFTRGVLFRIVEEWTGTWLSVLVSALVFGFMHIWNPNATVFSSLSIALTAGVILALLYVITRKLWVPIGLHIGWNLTLGGIYGAPVSGTKTTGLLQATLEGPEWLTGGAFGPEASILTLAVFLVFGVFLVRKIIRDGSWMKPLWRRRNDYH